MLCRPLHFLCLWFCATAVAQAQPSPAAGGPEGDATFQVQHWTTENGLPQNTVRNLLQSQDGYLWIGTSYGLARYDGMHFTVYISELVMSPSGDTRVWDLHEDGEKRIWVRTEAGLANFFQGRWEHFPCASPCINGIIYTSCASRDGGLWLAMRDGVRRFQGGRITRTIAEKDGLDQDRAARLYEDPAGRLWMGFQQSNHRMRWQRVDPNSGEVKDLTALVGPLDQKLLDLFPNQEGKVWYWGPNYLCCWTSGQVQSVALPPGWTDPGGVPPAHVSQSPTGLLYFINGGGGRVFGPVDGRFRPLKWQGEAIPADLRCVLADREGNVWIGDGSQGLFKMQRRCFSSLLTTNQAGSRNEVFSIAGGQRGRLWLGTSSGLTLRDQGRFEFFTNDQAVAAIPPIEQSLRAVLEDRSGTVWVGVNGRGLSRIQEGRFIHEPAADRGTTNQWTVTALLEGRDGSLWIGSDRGLLHRSPDGQFRAGSAEPKLADGYISALQQAPDGSLWIGTLESGVYHLDGGRAVRVTAKQGLLSDSATPLLVEADGTCWAGTASGLNRIRGGQVQTVTVEQGLFDNQAYCLLDDGRGYYWASCNRGIWRVRRTDLHAVADGTTNWVDCASFGTADGLASTEANGECQPNAARAPEGRLWFSTTCGAAVVDPASSLLESVPPPVVLEEVRADDEVIYKDGSPTPSFSATTGGAELRLPPSRERVLQLRYTANSFVNPDKVRFQHRLVGRDRTWQNAGDRRVAFYTDLKPAHYEFQVRACSSQAVWSVQPAALAFTLAPHFWETWSFLALCGAGVVAAAAAVQAYRLYWQRRVLLLQHQHALADERARIARDLHDDLGTALTGAALELDVLRRDGADKTALNRRLEGSAMRIRNLAARMREVVWAVNPHCDTLSSLASFLEQQAAQFLKADGLRCRLEFPEDIPPLPLDGETRHQLALAVREALSNVVRHASATQVILRLMVDPVTLVIRVQDDGCGFRPENQERAGHGLSNLRMRLEKLGGSCLCLSAPGSGTTIEFRVPLKASANLKGHNP
jgi:signal transduction histidine kinase/ligand-binding sensor domain-containing protein